MTTYRAGLSIAAFAAALMFAVSADAQQPTGAPPQSTRTQIAAKATCVPSGFAKLRRNCDADVGGCQKMPESCSKGWCCP